jgi:hypothetical protein
VVNVDDRVWADSRSRPSEGRDCSELRVVRRREELVNLVDCSRIDGDEDRVGERAPYIDPEQIVRQLGLARAAEVACSSTIQAPSLIVITTP